MIGQEPSGWREDGAYDDEFGHDDGRRWPLTWLGLDPPERWLWFERLWTDVCALRERYRLAVRSGWWEDQVQVETLAALAAWTERYDSGEWDDPAGKLGLLFDLERVTALLRDGRDPFHPERDRTPFVRHLIEIGGEPPPVREPPVDHEPPPGAWPPPPA